MSTSHPTITCPRCGATVATEFKFCPNCGLALRGVVVTPLDPPGTPPEPADADPVAPPTPADPDGPAAPVEPPAPAARTEPPPSAVPAAPSIPSTPERRQLTVMFCDLVGSVALSLELDPEDLRDVVRRYQEVATTGIERFEGYVAQYLGDGILAYFGYPVAHEDEPERAVRAGRAILDGIDRLGESLREEYGIHLAVRIGVHTGVAVVGEMGSGARRENLALGEVPNVAARVQNLAAENKLVASEATYRLVARTFEGRDLGRHTLKGTDREERIFEIVDERILGSALGTAGPSGYVTAIGREEESGVFDRCWKDVENGRGRVLFIHGEPGIGKSHLVRLLRQTVADRPHRCVDCRCSSHYRSTPFHPFLDWLRGVLNFYPEQAASDRLDIIEFVIRQNEITAPDAVELLAGMLSVPLEGSHRDLGIAPSMRREQNEKLLGDLLLRLCDDEPLLVVVEDVHWADPTTRLFLQHFAGQVRDRRVLVVLTSRSEPDFAWTPESRVETMALRRLNHAQVEAVIKDVARDQVIPPKLVEAIVEKTDGIPLFVQELTRMAIETDLAAECDECYRLGMEVPELSIPTTLQDSLMARLDRLLPVKEVAQICSTIGREFSFELARGASRMKDADLTDALQRLVEAELLYVDGIPPKSRYTFKHALIQEAAYESLLRGRRPLYHERIAEHLVSHPDLEESRPEIIAFHLARAQKRDRAAHYWRKAGEGAYERWANEEALDYFTRGLAQLEGLAPNDQIRHDRFLLQAGLAAASMQLRGYTHPSVLGAFEQALSYAGDLADRTLAAPAIRGIWTHYTVIGDHKRAQVRARQLADLAATSEDPRLHVHAELSLASTDFWRGRVVDAAERFERVLDEHARTMDNLPPALLTQHPRVGALSYLALARWYLGFPEQAERLGRASVTYASDLEHPFSLAFARGFYALLQTYFGRRDYVLQNAETVLNASVRYGFPFWSGIGTVLKAWATSDVDPENAIESINQAVDGLRRAGVQIWTSYPAALMADLMARSGRVAEAQDVSKTVTLRAAENEEGYFLPELMRIQSQCMRAAGRREESDALLREALDLARRQKARPIVLRILLDMADAGGTISPDLDALLHKTYDSFTEGVDTSEMIAARRMISA